jgi:hypothetical protein
MKLSTKLTIAATTLLCGIIACTYSTDPGEGVNHVHVAGLIVDLTFGPVFTILCSGIVVPLTVYFIKRYIKAGDDIRLKAIEAKETVDLERHEEIKKDIRENRESVTRQLSEFCRTQEKLHAQIDARFWAHYHTDGGDIVIAHGNGNRDTRIGGI